MRWGNDPWDAGNATSPRRAPWILVLAIVVAIAVGTALFLSGRPQDRASGGGTDVTSPAPTAGRVATLYFADRDGKSFVPEDRELPEGEHFEMRVEAVLRALSDGPRVGDVLPVLPETARLRRVYFDADAATLYADFDAALVRDHPGGSAAEWQTLTAIVRTVRANFPEVRRLQILVQGKPIESIAGHFDTSRPIELDTWQ